MCVFCSCSSITFELLCFQEYNNPKLRALSILKNNLQYERKKQTITISDFLKICPRDAYFLK